MQSVSYMYMDQPKYQIVFVGFFLFKKKANFVSKIKRMQLYVPSHIDVQNKLTYSLSYISSFLLHIDENIWQFFVLVVLWGTYL